MRRFRPKLRLLDALTGNPEPWETCKNPGCEKPIDDDDRSPICWQCRLREDAEWSQQEATS